MTGSNLIGAGISALSAAGLAGLLSGMAPEISRAQDGSDEVVEEIVVTGTRISRDPNHAGALPVQSVNADDIQLTGHVELSEVLKNVPSLGTSRTTQDSSGEQGFAPFGYNVLSLRGLGNARTLVLVDGRRYVGSINGAVDIGTIPAKLVERVEVLTGGASAIYGADAVTGVVNFIMRDDFEGLSVDATTGISADGDSRQSSLTATWGLIFAADRGNVALSIDYRDIEGMTAGERPEEQFATAGSAPNPALRFQSGDIDAATTPNFARFYDYANTGLYDFGLPIPATDDFVAAYSFAFGEAPSLTQQELDLIQRAEDGYPLAVLPGRTVPFTSPYGTIMAGNPYTFAGFDPLTPIDIDGNSVPDCLDSFTGYNSVFGQASFGVIGGCWTINQDGSYAPVRDGLIGGNFDGFGGDSAEQFYAEDRDILVPNDRLTVNLRGHFKATDRANVFGELTYSVSDAETGAGPNSYWDSLLGAPDNPFLPAFLAPLAQQAGGIAITIDPLLFDSRIFTEIETARAVVGLEGQFENGWSYEFSANTGRVTRTFSRSNQVIVDRFFAAIDAVTDPATGQPACRSDVDSSTAPLGTPFNVPDYDPGYFSFTPGVGNCVPLNIWAGRPGLTSAAVNWVTRDDKTRTTTEQFVATAFVAGDTRDWFELPGGPISVVVGAEFRDESATFVADPWLRGIIPAGAPFPEGTNISDWSGNASLQFLPKEVRQNINGGYDTTEVFFETALPIVVDRPGVRELTLEAAIRLADYSTIGSTTTWKTNLIYAPIYGLTLRGGFSQAVRAPNIVELFLPDYGVRSNVNDPCDSVFLGLLAQNDPVLAQQTQANCVTALQSIGVDPFDPVTGIYAFTDPLNAPVSGVTSGNPLLSEETAETITAGLVFQPEFIAGLSLTVDYWSIEIDDAIASAGAQNIVNGCYQGVDLKPVFCDLIDRNADSASIFFGGLSFIRETDVNFAKLESAGVDVALTYVFELGPGDFTFKSMVTNVDYLNLFRNPLDPADVDPELGEIKRPEWSGNLRFGWELRDWSVSWHSQYWGEQLLGEVEIENVEQLYGSSVMMDSQWEHNLSLRYAMSDRWQVYGGVNNITDEKPFITEFAFPFNARGRFFFLGIEFAQ